MTSREDFSFETRVLLVAPTAKDARITSDLLSRAGLTCTICQDLNYLAVEVRAGGAAALITDEAISSDGVQALLKTLAEQPAWSDFPIVIMARGHDQTPVAGHLLRSLSNVTILERPAPMRSVSSAVQAAVRGRLRQYQARQQFQAIRQAEERLLFSMEAGNLGTWEVDLHTQEMVCSARYKQNFGRNPNEPLTYSQSYEVIHPEDRERIRDAVARALSDRTDYVAEYRNVWPDTSEHWVSVRGRAEYAPDGSPVRIAGVSLDVTDQKHMELHRQSVLDAERAARSEAERVGRMKDEFLATLSHELRTPLNAILGWSHLLQTAPMDPAEIKDGLTTIERNARVQTQLIDDLLDMSRIISGKIRIDFQSIDPVAVLTAAVATVRPAATAKGVKIETAFARDIGSITGDPGRLQQVVWNLLSNAIKFTPRNGIVRVSVRRLAASLEIAVADSGQGIDPAFLPYVFERFRQADAKTTREHGGLGLGLAIVKHLVELHGGDIAVESGGRNAGSTFTILLPTASSPTLQEPGSPLSARAKTQPAVFMNKSSLAGLKLLVVDDEPDARELLRRVLEAKAARVVVAGSASEAIAAAQGDWPDVIISDIGMPVVDGYELIKMLRKLESSREAKLPAIALTAFAREEDRRQALAAGFNAHLTKPVDTAELLAAIHSISGRNPDEMQPGHAVN